MSFDRVITEAHFPKYEWVYLVSTSWELYYAVEGALTVLGTLGNLFL